MMSAHGLVLAAGRGERLRPITDQIPKPLVPLLDDPVIAYVMRQLVSAGVRTLHVNTNWLADKIDNAIAAGSWDVPVRVHHEDRLLGAAGSLRKVSALTSAEAMVVSPADIVHSGDIDALLAAHAAHPAPITILAVPVPDTWDGDRVRLDGDRVIEYLVSSGDLSAPYGCFGVCIVNREFALTIDPTDVGLTNQVLPRESSRGQVRAHVQNGVRAIDIGVPELLQDAPLEILEGRYGAAHRRYGTRHAVPAEELNAAGHQISGSVYVSRRALLGRGIRVRGPAVISDGAIIGDGALVERAVVHPGVVVPAGGAVVGGLLSSGSGLRTWLREWSS